MFSEIGCCFRASGDQMGTSLHFALTAPTVPSGISKCRCIDVFADIFMQTQEAQGEKWRHQKLKMKNGVIYSCPMKTHHSSDAHICGLLKGVQNCIIYNYYLGQMQCFRTKISIQVTPLTHDVTSASKLRYSHIRRIQKDLEISFKCFLFTSRSPVISPQFWQLWRNT